MLRKTRFNLPGIPQHVTQRNNNLELSPEKPDQMAGETEPVGGEFVMVL